MATNDIPPRDPIAPEDEWDINWNYFRNSEYFGKLENEDARRLTYGIVRIRDAERVKLIMSLMEYTGPTLFQAHNNYRVCEIYTNDIWRFDVDWVDPPRRYRTDLHDQRLMWQITTNAALKHDLMWGPKPVAHPWKFAIGEGFYLTPNFGYAAFVVYEEARERARAKAISLNQDPEAAASAIKRVLMPLACIPLGCCKEYNTTEELVGAEQGVPPGYDSVCMRGVREPPYYTYMEYQQMRFRIHTGDWQLNRLRLRDLETNIYFTDKPDNIRMPYVVELELGSEDKPLGNSALSPVTWPLVSHVKTSN